MRYQVLPGRGLRRRVFNGAASQEVEEVPAIPETILRPVRPLTKPFSDTKVTISATGNRINDVMFYRQGFKFRLVMTRAGNGTLDKVRAWTERANDLNSTEDRIMSRDEMRYALHLVEDELSDSDAEKYANSLEEIHKFLPIDKFHDHKVSVEKALLPDAAESKQKRIDEIIRLEGTDKDSPALATEKKRLNAELDLKKATFTRGQYRYSVVLEIPYRPQVSYINPYGKVNTRPAVPQEEYLTYSAVIAGLPLDMSLQHGQSLREARAKLALPPVTPSPQSP